MKERALSVVVGPTPQFSSVFFGSHIVGSIQKINFSIDAKEIVTFFDLRAVAGIVSVSGTDALYIRPDAIYIEFDHHTPMVSYNAVEGKKFLGGIVKLDCSISVEGNSLEITTVFDYDLPESLSWVKIKKVEGLELDRLVADQQEYRSGEKFVVASMTRESTEKI
jgi:hypothetical protein